MMKTDVPGLVTDGNGAFVQKDLSAFAELKRKRQEAAERQALRDELALMRAQVDRLEAIVAELQEKNK